MKLLVILLCLLSERFLIHSASYQRFSWFEHYYLSIKNIMDKYNLPANTALMLALIVVPPIVVVSLIYLLLDSILFGLFGFIINIVLFFYCLGPQNPFYPLDAPSDSSNEERVGAYLAAVNNQLFSVIFWYVIGGPIAALVFRLISLSQNIPQVELLAKDVTELLEWIPARLTVLLYLLVGNFQAGSKRFMHFFLAKPALNLQMLSECGLLAVRYNGLEEVPMPIAEKLVEHATIVLLVLIALFTLVAWL